MFKKYLYGILFLIAAWYFAMGIAPDTFNSHYVIITMLAGVVTTVLLGATLFGFFPAKANLEGEAKKKDDDAGCVLIAAIIAFFFCYSIFLIYNGHDRVKQEIAEHGVYATGRIIDGSSYKTRKVDMTDVTIQFTAADGQIHTVKHDVSAEEFKRYYQYQEIPLVYSSRYPSLLEILHDDAAIARYAKQEVRNIELRDLLNLLSLKGREEIRAHLDSINQKWEPGSGRVSGTYAFNNPFKNIAVSITPGKALMYLHSNFDPGLFKEELKEMGFEFVEADAKSGMQGTYFMNDSFIVNKRLERVQTDPSQGILEYDRHTLVEISKLK